MKRCKTRDSDYNMVLVYMKELLSSGLWIFQ